MNDKSWNLHVQHTDMNLRELRASMKNQEDKMNAMEAAYYKIINKERKSLVQSSFTENATSSLIAKIESDQEVEIYSDSSGDNGGTADIWKYRDSQSTRVHPRGLVFSIFSNVGRSSRLPA